MEIIGILVLVTIIAVLLLRVLNYLVIKFYAYNTIKRFPGPRAYPLIGNAHLFTGTLEDSTSKLLELNKIYQSPWRLWLGNNLIIYVDDPEYIKSILNNTYALKKSELYKFIRSYAGNGLVSASVSKWQLHRRILQPIFNHPFIQSHTDLIATKAINLIRILESFDEKELDVLHCLHLCALDVAYDALFGMDLNLQNDPKCKLDEHIESMLKLSMDRMSKLWLYPDFIYFNTPAGKKENKYRTFLDNITFKIMKMKKESMTENKITEDSKIANTGENKGALLDTLFNSLNDDGKYTEQDIRDEINTMIIAGSDTVATTLLFLLSMLATYPEIQEKVYEELYVIYGSRDPQELLIIYDDLKNMKLLDRVIKETLRLFPPGPLIARQTTKDIKVNETIIIPSNSTAILGIFSCQRSEKYWSNPLQFDPDRFLPGNCNSKNLIPFSYGKRDCIGQKLAMMETKIIIATILRKFIVQIDHPESIEEIDLIFGVSLKTVKPIILRFKKR